jgi:protein-tyrosine phosphatase
MNKVSSDTDKVFLYKQWDKQLYRHELQSGSITMMPKPPGGQSLSHFIEYLKYKGIDTLVSLLQFEENNAYTLNNEGFECKTLGIDFINFPIQDHAVPQFFIPFNHLVDKLTTDVNKGRNIAIHCYAGIGRTGLTAASILIKSGMQVDSAVISLSQTRTLKVPETIEQISWLHHFSDQLSLTQTTIQ